MVERFILVDKHLSEGGGGYMEPDDQGEWVRYSDFSKAHTKIEQLTKVLNREKDDHRSDVNKLRGQLGAATKRANKAESERDEAHAEIKRLTAQLKQARMVQDQLMQGRYEQSLRAEKAEAEIERDETKALLQRAVDLIKGDLTGSEWKRACNTFVKDAQTALKGSAGMKFYRATVEILIRANGEGEALDGISGLLTETGMYDNNLIADWAYSHGPVEVNVPENEQVREEYFADGNLNKGLPASTASSHDLEAYGREKMREGLQMAADIAMQRDEENGGVIFAEAYEFRDAILAEMEKEGG